MIYMRLSIIFEDGTLIKNNTNSVILWYKSDYNKHK